MARKLTGTPKKRDMEVQGTQMTEAALKKRSQGIWIRRISAMMSALLACALFYVLMKPAITMENGNGSGNGAQLVCAVPEHVHTEQCWGYDHPETEPVYGLSRELECSFVPHVHDMDCYDEAGELICGISERYIHVHDDLCYDQGNLACLLEESPWNPEEEAVQEQVLICDLPETSGHMHTDACYTVTYLTDEEPVCGLKEGGHVHTEDCYGPVLICEEEHEHTDECYAEGLVCHLEEGTEHVHTLSCYPSIRELTCGLEETEGHVHDEDCYAFLTVEKEPHVHTEECYADDQLMCGEMEIRSHQHTEACWHVTQVMLSGGHVHNSECVKVLLCGMQEHVHTKECYSGPEAEIQLLLAENADTEKNGEAAQEADADMQEMLLEEEQLLNEDMDAAVDGVHLEDGEVISSDKTEPLQEEDGVLLSEEEELFSEWELVNEDPEWEDVQWEDEAMEEPSDDGHEMSASQEVSEETTEPEHAVTDDAAESPASEQITEDPTETENSVADDAAGSRFEEAYYLQDVETLEDGTFAVHLHEDEGIYFRTILEKAGVEAEQVDATSDIPFLDIREDSFVCRFAFTEGSVVIRAGGEDLTVKCTYAGPRTETENTAETGEAERSAETAADGLDNRVNAEVETGEDSAEGTDTELDDRETAGDFHSEETAVDGQENGTQAEDAAREAPAGETDAEQMDSDAAGEDSAEQTAVDGQVDGTQAEDASGDNSAEGTSADQADSDAAGEDRAVENAADGQAHKTESEDGTEETSAGEIDTESEGNEAAGENGTEASLTFVRDLEKVEDGVYSVRLSMDSAVRIGDIPELEKFAPEEIIISSEIEDLETGTDYFACRKAFEQGNVILTSGEIRVTVQCAYVPAAVEDEAGENDTAVDGTGDAANGETGNTDADNGENAGEDADAAEGTGNVDASGEEGQDAAEPEIQDAAQVLLNGEETDLLRLEENPEDAEAVLDILRTYLALKVSESQESGLEEDAAAAESDPADDDEEIRLTFSRVFGMEAEEAFEGTAGIYMPVHARFSDLLPEGSYLTSVNCQLFHIDLDHGEILPVQNFEVEISDEEIVSLAFETERTGNWVLLCTLDYAFEERAAVLTLDFSDFDALMLEDTEETGITVIEAEPEMNAEPAPGRRLLAKGRNNGQKKEENGSGFGGLSIDLARLLEAVYAQNGAGEGEFQGIRMLMENLAGAEFSIETLVQEMSEGGVSCDGMSLQILDNGSILLRGKHMTLTIRIQGFAREKQEIYVYTFGEQKTVSMSEIFRASGMPEQFVPARFAYEVSDEELVTLIREGNDWQVTANRSFDEVKLFVRRGWYSGMILLRNPRNIAEPGTEIRSSDGAASIVLNEEAVLPEGTELTVQPSEGMDIRPVLDQDFGENADVQVKWFDISLGDVHEIQAVVTLHGVIDVPEFAKKRGNVQARVYHAGSSGLEVLDAEVHGTDISFVTDGFSEFAVAYTVDFHWEMNGETYEFTLPGGGAVSLTRLLSALGFQEMLASDDLENTVQTDEGNAAAEETADGEVLVIHDADDSGNESEKVAGNETDNSIGRNLQAFTEQIESVSFSDSALVWTGKVETDTTVGQLKVDNALECLLSSGMTADMLEEANNMQIAAGDWALISLMPFTSEESLNVTMKNGDVFVIRVTDAQIRKTVISASGEAYDITVTFDDDTGIPDTADLVVREIMEEDPEYAAYYAAASEHVNASDTESDTAAAEDESQETNGSGNARRDIAQARFFDIEIWNDGSKIEPLKPVSVEIRLVDSAELDDAVPEVLHFAKSGLEIIDYTDKSTDENGRVFAFETDGFSVYSVIYTVDFHYEIDGKTYKFHLPGGGFLSLEHLVEALGLAESDDKADVNASVEAGEEDAGISTEDGNTESQEESETESSEASDAFETTMRLNNMSVSDATKQFMADVANVEFSSPELVWVGKVDAGTTVGQMKETMGLEIQYSADLTDEQIEEINAQTVEAGDWALFSLRPFMTEEKLTISMKNGDTFVVKVSDGQSVSDYESIVPGREYILYVVRNSNEYYALGRDGRSHYVGSSTEVLEGLDSSYSWSYGVDSTSCWWYNGSTYLNLANNDSRNVIGTHKDYVFMSAYGSGFDIYRYYDGSKHLSWDTSGFKVTNHQDVPIRVYMKDKPYYDFTVAVNNENYGSVSCAETTTYGNKTNKNDIIATPADDCYFVGWRLGDDALNNNTYGTTISAGMLKFPDDNMTLTAVFGKNYTSPATQDINEWVDGLLGNPLVSDKTAHVVDYDNRIYEINLSASSSRYTIDRDVRLEFITDKSRSMYFPETLLNEQDITVNGSVNLGQWLLNNGDPDEVYYVVADINNTATMYAVYFSGNDRFTRWSYVDASYYLPYDNASTSGRIKQVCQVSNGNTTINVTNQVESGKNNSGKMQTLTGKIYTAGTKPPKDTADWDRLSYLTAAVDAASRAIYQLDPGAQLGLVTFASAADGGTLYGVGDQDSFIAELHSIQPTGGTNQTSAFNLINDSNPPIFTQNSGKRQIALLITDGAPQGTEWQYIERAAAITERKDVEIWTLGLGLERVGDNKQKLMNLASEGGYAGNAEDANQLVTAVQNILQMLLVKATVIGEVYDTVDPAFYPVDASGNPIEEGFYYADTNGGSITRHNSAPSDRKKSYYQWVNSNGTWAITYYNQDIKWPEDGGWRSSFYIKAKEDFMGGNKISTNSGFDNRVEANRVKHSGAPDGYYWLNEDHTSFRADFKIPYVNVDELTMNENSTEWRVYLGTEVDPATELKELWNKIIVNQVVKDNGADDEVITITNGNQKYYSDDVQNDAVAPDGASNETLPLSHFVNPDLIDTLLQQIDNENPTGSAELTYRYFPYGHDTVGTFNIQLTKSINTDAGSYYAPGKHETTETGDNKEVYTLTVTYAPVNNGASENYAQTTSGKSAGKVADGYDGPTGEFIQSKNTHKIHVFAKSLEIIKQDMSGNNIDTAKFKLYRTAKKLIDPDTGEETSEYEAGTEDLKIGSETKKVIQIGDELSTSDGIITVNDLSFSPDGTFYLLETKAPDGYNRLTEPIEMHLYLNDAYMHYLPPKDIVDKAFSDENPYNWTQTVNRFIYSSSDIGTGDAAKFVMTVKNNPGYELPSTGGFGTNWIYLSGIMLTGLAGVCLLQKRSREKPE